MNDALQRIKACINSLARRARLPRIETSAWIRIAAAVGMVVWGWIIFGATGHDDPHITYWAAYTLSDWGEIINHSGERVEQSSSLTHTTLLALGRRLTGAEVPTLGHYMTLGAAVLTLLRLGALVEPDQAPRASIAAVALASAPLVVYWSLGGLEGPIYAWLGVELMIALRAWRRSEPRFPPRRVVQFSLVALAFVAARPEAPILLICTMLGLLGACALGSREQLPRLLVATAIVVVAAALITWWRWQYFGRLFPQPVAAKMGGGVTTAALLGGWRYFVSFTGRVETAVLGLGLAMSLTSLRRLIREGELETLMALAMSVGGICFAILVGGDWMVGSRFLAQIAPWMAVLMMRCVPFEAMRTSLRAGLAVGLILLNGASGVDFAARSAKSMPFWMRPKVEALSHAARGDLEYTFSERTNVNHARDTFMIDDLDTLVGEIARREGRVKILSLQAGMVMYHIARRHFGQVEFYDRAGLVDRHYEEIGKKYGIEHNTLGLKMSQADFFRIAKAESDEVREELFRPHIIFDLYPAAEAAARRNGYVTVYVQEGRISARADPDPRCLLEPDELSPDATAQERQQHAISTDMTRRRYRPLPAYWTAGRNIYEFIALREDIAIELGYLVEAPKPKRKKGAKKGTPPPMKYVPGPRERVRLDLAKLWKQIRPVPSPAEPCEQGLDTDGENDGESGDESHEGTR